MDNLILLLKYIKNFISDADEAIIILMIVMMICLFIISLNLFFANRKYRKIQQSIADYTSKSALIIKMTEEINILTENISVLEISYYERKEISNQLLVGQNTLLITIKRKELLNARLNNNTIELEIKIEELKWEIIEEKITLLEFDRKIKEATRNFDKLSVYKYRIVSEVKLLKDTKTGLETENTKLLEQKNKLEQENKELGIQTQRKNEIIIIDPENIATLKYIGYTPNNNFQSNCYPAVMMPQPKSIIKFPRKGRTGRRGFTEPEFEKLLDHYFNDQNKIQLNIDKLLVVSDYTRPYEPDFTLQDEKENLNLFIDIEIDEPYDGYTRAPTHFKGQDNYRNQFFSNRGWIVIRFSEKQIIDHPKGCCKFISDVIQSINYKFTIPQELQKVNNIQNEPFWSKNQAEKWADERYRESYLKNVEFQSNIYNNDYLGLIETENEKHAEDNVTPLEIKSVQITGIYNENNAHERDERINFIPESNTWLIDKNPHYNTIDEILDIFYHVDLNEVALNEFEKDKELYSNIRSFFQSNGNERPENDIAFNQFLNFYNEKTIHNSQYRTEWKIFDEDYFLVGSCELILKKPDGNYALYNWKPTKNDRIPRNHNNLVVDFQADGQNADYEVYAFQLCLYKSILIRKYNLNVTEMSFLQFNKKFNHYLEFRVMDNSEKTTKLLNFAKQYTQL